MLGKLVVRGTRIVIPLSLRKIVLDIGNEGHQARLGGKFHHRYLPVVFTGLENTPKVANTGKYWQLNFLTLK